MAERFFRILSLGFLTVGVVVGVAVADRNVDPSIRNPQDLVYLVKDVEEAHEINSMKMVPVYVVQDAEKSEAVAKNLPTELPRKSK